MMLTRCPACTTTFRVTPEQLKARHGKVRCGQCQHIFDALDALVAAPLEEPVATEPATQPVVQPEPPSHATANEEQEAWPSTVPTSFDAPAQEPVQPLATTEEALAVMALDDSPVLPAAEPASATGTEPIAEAEPEPESASAEETAAAPEPVPGASGSPESPEPPEPPAPPAPAEELVAPTQKASLPRSSEIIQRVQRIEPLLHEEDEDAPRGRVWLWALASLLALTVLLVQAFMFRVEFAALVPEIRPALQSLCESAGCDLPLPRKADQLSIEASDLQPDSQQKRYLVLTATLKNRAQFTQIYPHVELTLTDAQDKPLLRKIIAPIEYLPKGTDMAAGFVANGEIVVNLALIPENAAKAAAAGYRLYLFFP